MSTFLEKTKERARQDKKTIVLPESMDRRTFEAAETILKEDIANLIIIGTPEEIEENSKGLDISGAKIINQTTIGEYATIGAGAVVTKPIPGHCTAVGVPARVVKETVNLT